MGKINILQIFNPNRWKAFGEYNKGLRYVIKGRTAEACEVFSAAVSLHPNNPVYRGMLGMTYVDLQNYDAGLKELLLSTEHGIKGNMIEFEVYAHLGYIYVKNKRRDEAISYYEKCLKLWRDNATTRLKKSMVYEHLGQLYKMRGEIEKAEEMFSKALEQ
jgi:tetratricopeptide (TPR) repeat protein